MPILYVMRAFCGWNIWFAGNAGKLSHIKLKDFDAVVCCALRLGHRVIDVSKKPYIEKVHSPEADREFLDRFVKL